VDKVYTVDRTPVEGRLLEALKAAIPHYGLGIEVLDVALLDVHAPSEVHPKFRDVASAMEDKQRYINESQVYAEEIMTRVGGETHRIISLAEADKEAAILAAKGSVSGFLAQLEGYAIAPEAFRFRRYTETVEKVLSGNRKIIRPAASKGVALDFWRFSRKQATTLPSTLPSSRTPENSSPMNIEDFLKQRRLSRE
jgi:membrane protease subunit HflK